MTYHPLYTVFLDTSVLIAATLSSKGASAEILNLCRHGQLKGVVSDAVMAEFVDVLCRKYPHQSTFADSLITLSRLEITKIKKSPLIQKAKKWITDSKDAHVLAAAAKTKVDYLITLDVRDFIWDATVSKKSGLSITTPGDFMAILRA